MSELRSDAYRRYSLGYTNIKPVPAQFEKYILSNFPQDKGLIDKISHPIEREKS